MKVVLFRINWWDLKAAGIGLMTVSQYSHAAIIPDGDTRLLDASETRGNVDYNKQLIEFGSKEVVIYEVPFDCSDALIHAKNMIGREYNWKGIFAWIFRTCTLGLLKFHSSENLYCFEYVLYVLSFIKELRAASEKTFDKVFTDIVDSDDVLSVLNKVGCPRIYRGPAKDFKLL